MTVAQRVARNSLVQLAGRGITMGVSLATLTLLSRYLGPEAFGQYQLVIAFLLLVNVSDFGVATIATRYLSTGDHDADELMGNVLVVRATLAVTSTLIAITAAAAFYPPEILAGIAIASLSFPFMIAAGAYAAVFAANLRMEFAALGNIAQATVTLCAMIFVVASGGGVLALLAAYTAGVLANSVVCWFFARRFVRPRFAFDPSLSGRLLREAAPLGLAVIVITAYGRLDILLLRAFTGDEAVGYYGFAYRVVDLAFPLSFFFVGSVFPLLSSYHATGEPHRFRALYQRSHDVLSIASVVMVTSAVLFAGPLVRLIGGHEYAPAVASLQILALAVALIWVSNLIDHGLIAAGRQSALLWIACFGLVVNVTSNLVLIPLYREEGAAVATVLTELAVLVPAFVILGRYMGSMPSFWLTGRMLPIAGAATAFVLLSPLHPRIEAPIVVVIFAAGILAMRVISLDELKELLLRRPSAEAQRLAPGAKAEGLGS